MTTLLCTDRHVAHGRVPLLSASIGKRLSHRHDTLFVGRPRCSTASVHCCYTRSQTIGPGITWKGTSCQCVVTHEAREHTSRHVLETILCVEAVLLVVVVVQRQSLTRWQDHERAVVCLTIVIGVGSRGWKAGFEVLHIAETVLCGHGLALKSVRES